MKANRAPSEQELSDWYSEPSFPDEMPVPKVRLTTIKSLIIRPKIYTKMDKLETIFSSSEDWRVQSGLIKQLNHQSYKEFMRSIEQDSTNLTRKFFESINKASKFKTKGKLVDKLKFENRILNQEESIYVKTQFYERLFSNPADEHIDTSFSSIQINLSPNIKRGLDQLSP
jgi:hypothetical protein